MSDEKLKALEEEVEQLTHRLGVLQDIDEIRKLQHKYGYYFDSCLYEEVVELFAEDGEVHFMGGIYRGKESVARLYLDRLRNRFTGGKDGIVYGLLYEHIQFQDVITVMPDRKTAKGRYRGFMQAGFHESSGREPKQWWEGGIYENVYVKEDGVWKFKVLNYRGWWHADFETGWAYTPPNLYPFYTKTKAEDPDNPHAPDDLVTDPKPFLWPETNVIPFHYPHPVTGKWWQGEEEVKRWKNDSNNWRKK